MARSSTGLPYLIRRPDTGKYAYWRELPDAIVPHVTGTLVLSWSTHGHRALDGTARVVKVSLKTGDEAMARVRWSSVNGQVEAMVQLGRILAHEQADRERFRNDAEPLSPEAITTIAAQARHDLLAEHDRTWIDPTFTSPLTAVVLGQLRRAAVPSAAKTVQAAQRFADEVLLREAHRNLADRDPGLLDAEIAEAELASDPSVLDLDALRRGAVTKLTPTQMAHVGDAIPSGRLPGEVEVRLAENGLGHGSISDRRALALALLRVTVAGLEDIKDRHAGAAISTPARPATMAPPPPPAPRKPPLSSMRPFWIKDRRPGDKETADKGLYLRFFIDLFGDLPVDQVTPPLIADYLAQLELCPRNVPHELRHAKLQDRIAWAAKPENISQPRLKRQTVNGKGLGCLSSLMEQARKLGHVVKNPCQGMALTLKPGDVVTRLPYSLQDLRLMFKSGVYAHSDPGRSFILRGADCWLPLLGLFTGARLEELGQLLVNDIRVLDGIPCIIITDVPEEDVDPSSDASKAVKTLAGRRVVPIHAELIRCGFLIFVEEQRRRGSIRLFPELPRYRGRVTKEWSKSWGRFTDKHVTASPAKTFHSFRHLFIAKLRAANVDPNIIKALVGHAIADTTLNYGVEDGEVFGSEVLHVALQKFKVDGLDLSHLYRSECAA